MFKDATAGGYEIWYCLSVQSKVSTRFFISQLEITLKPFDYRDRFERRRTFSVDHHPSAPS